jgi:hypothetical protein
MAMMRPNRSHEDGFTVMELVWSASILLVVAMGVIGVLNFAAESTRRSAARVTALNVATQQLEKARSMPYDSVGVVYADGSHGSPAGTLAAVQTINGTYQVTTSVIWARTSAGRAQYKKVYVAVAWTNAGGGSLDVSTNIFGKSFLVNTGDMQVTILYKTSNQPVPGVLVTVTSAAGAYSAYTDEAGVAFFGYIPSGTYAVSAAITGYIVDVGPPLDAVGVTADGYSPVTAYAQEASSIRVSMTALASDGTTTPLSGVTVNAKKTGSTVVLTATTGTDGTVLFPTLVVGEYVIDASMTGYGPATGNVSVTVPGSDYSLALSMSARVGLTIRVVDGAGAIVSGALVYVKGPSSTINVAGSPATTPSNNGEVSFTSLVNGTYALTASKTGYTSATGSVVYDGTQGVIELKLTVPTSTTGTAVFATYIKDRNTGDHEHPHTAHDSILHTGSFRVTRSGYSSINFTSDVNGAYTLTGLAPGTWTVTENMNNTTGSPVSFVISVGETTLVNVYATVSTSGGG